MFGRSGRVALTALALCAAGAAEAREMVAFEAAVRPGTIVVSTAARRLYLVLGNGAALSYPVAVGRPGKQWFGTRLIDGKHVRPAWAPPREVKRDNPRLPNLIPGGAPNNPMGVAALTLSGGEYAIHGTNRPGSIGTYASYGCIRMHNHDIADLFQRVAVGTPVMVTR
jgi:lipoprotein-anchoring transpeptidase ErfK/SrfK